MGEFLYFYFVFMWCICVCGICKKDIVRDICARLYVNIEISSTLEYNKDVNGSVGGDVRITCFSGDSALGVGTSAGANKVS